MDDGQVEEYSYYEFINPIVSEIVESALGKAALISGVTLQGRITRNRNLYSPRIKQDIARGLLKQPIIFGAPRDHIDVKTDQDIVSSLREFRLLAARYIIGHITEALYDSKIDAIRYKGEIRNTSDNPDIVERVLAGDIRFTSIGGVGRRVPTITPKWGPVTEVISIMTTHMSLVAIPGDPASEITSVVIKESFDPTELEEVKEALSGNEGGNQPGEGTDGQGGSQDGGTNGGGAPSNGGAQQTAGQTPAPTGQIDTAAVRAILSQIDEIRKQRDDLAQKLGMSEQERKKLEDDAQKYAAIPTKDEIKAIEAKLGEVEQMRSEIERFKRLEDQRAKDAHDKIVADTVALMTFADDAAKTAKIEELTKLTDNSLMTIQDTLVAEKAKVDAEILNARRSVGRVTLGNPQNPNQDFAEQYAKLTAAEKNKLWELWVASTLGEMYRLERQR